MGFFSGIKGAFQDITGQTAAKQSRRAARRAAEQERRAVQARNARERRRTLAEQRIQQALTVSTASASGAGLGSSPIQGVQASLATQTAESVGFAAALETLDARRFAFEEEAGQQARKAQGRGALFSLAGTAAGAAVGAPFGQAATGAQFGGQIAGSFTAQG